MQTPITGTLVARLLVDLGFHGANHAMPVYASAQRSLAATMRKASIRLPFARYQRMTLPSRGHR
jgi:hypothetical protein